MNILKPFHKPTALTGRLILIGWSVVFLGAWLIYGFSETHLFPTIPQVLKGFSILWNQGIVSHIGSSLLLCAMSLGLSVLVSLGLVYLSPLPLIKPIAQGLSKFRYLPLTGLAFYITILLDGGRSIQIWLLTIFLSTYLVTSLLSVLSDIPEEEFDHARALGCSRWEVLWEVVVKGRLDYVMEAIRQNLAIIWMCLVTVESIVVAAGGLGVLIKNSDKLMNQGMVVALQIVILLLGLLIDWLLTVARRGLFRYSKI